MADFRSKPQVKTSVFELKKEARMNLWRNLAVVILGVSVLAGCTTNPYTGEREAGKAGIYGGVGAVTGAVIGAATSSKKDRGKGALIGAAVGGATGAARCAETLT